MGLSIVNCCELQMSNEINVGLKKVKFKSQNRFCVFVPYVNVLGMNQYSMIDAKLRLMNLIVDNKDF